MFGTQKGTLILENYPSIFEALHPAQERLISLEDSAEPGARRGHLFQGALRAGKPRKALTQQPAKYPDPKPRALT